MILLDAKIPAFDRYLEDSENYWTQVDRGRPRGGEYVVVELLHNNAPLLLSNLFIARCAAQLYGARLAAVLSNRFLGWPSPTAQVRRLGAAFGVERFYQIELPKTSESKRSRGPWPRWLGASERDRVLRRIGALSGPRLRQAVLDLAIGGIPAGDLVYDNYLRTTGQASIETVDAALVDEIAAAFARMSQYRDIMNRKDHVACVVSDCSYVDYGGLLRAAVALGKTGIAKIIASPSYVRIYRTLAGCYEFPWPLAEDAAFVRHCLGAELTRRAAGFFPPRRQYAEENPYFQVAYAPTMARPGVAELRAQLGLSPGVPAIGIMAPMFDDAPHSIPDLLYQDSGQWLAETLAICADVDHVTWLVRNHPYSVAIGATGEFDRIVRPYAGRCPHIKICPSNISTDSLFGLLHAGVSVASTALLEFAAAGIPGILCGRPYYADQGFILRARSAAEYAGLLKSIETLQPLTAAQISAAKEIAYINFHCAPQANGLTPSPVDTVGRDVTVDDIARYWEAGSATLKSYRFADDPMWRNFRRMTELDRSFLLRFDELEAATRTATVTAADRA
jgi:hypothetical protein